MPITDNEKADKELLGHGNIKTTQTCPPFG
jgi:hypothetical protein